MSTIDWNSRADGIIVQQDLRESRVLFFPVEGLCAADFTSLVRHLHTRTNTTPLPITVPHQGPCSGSPWFPQHAQDAWTRLPRGGEGGWGWTQIHISSTIWSWQFQTCSTLTASVCEHNTLQNTSNILVYLFLLGLTFHANPHQVQGTGTFFFQ